MSYIQPWDAVMSVILTDFNYSISASSVFIFGKMVNKLKPLEIFGGFPYIGPYSMPHPSVCAASPFVVCFVRFRVK